MSPNERNILIDMNVGHFLTHFNMLIFPSLLLPLTSFYHLPFKEVLPLSFWMYFLFGVSALPWGILTDRIGARIMLFLFFLGCGVAEIMAGLYISSPFLFSLSLAGVGLFAGIYHPAGLGMISRGIKRMSFALGINGMFGNLGLAASPLLAGIMNYFLGIRFTFISVGVLNLIGGLLLIFFPFSDPPRGGESREKGDLYFLGPFLMLCVCMMLVGIVYRGNTVVLPSYFELKNKKVFLFLHNLFGLSLSRNVVATLTSSAVFAVGMVGQFFGGLFAEKHDPRWGYLLFHSMTILLALGMYFLSNIPLIVVTMCYFLFLLGMQPIENTLVAYFTPEKLRHSGFGIKFILNFGVGSFSVFLVGIIKHSFSLSAVFLFFAGTSSLLVGCILGLLYLTRGMDLRG